MMPRARGASVNVTYSAPGAGQGAGTRFEKRREAIVGFLCNSHVPRSQDIRTRQNAGCMASGSISHFVSTSTGSGSAAPPCSFLMRS